MKAVIDSGRAALGVWLTGARPSSSFSFSECARPGVSRRVLQPSKRRASYVRESKKRTRSPRDSARSNVDADRRDNNHLSITRASSFRQART